MELLNRSGTGGGGGTGAREYGGEMSPRYTDQLACGREQIWDGFGVLDKDPLIGRARGRRRWRREDKKRSVRSLSGTPTL